MGFRRMGDRTRLSWLTEKERVDSLVIKRYVSPKIIYNLVKRHIPNDNVELHQPNPLENMSIHLNWTLLHYKTRRL